MIATETIVIYRTTGFVVVAEVYAGERYETTEGDLIYTGTLEDFYLENPEYKTE